MQHCDPPVTADVADPMMMNNSLAPIPGNARRGRRRRLAARTASSTDVIIVYGLRRLAWNVEGV